MVRWDEVNKGRWTFKLLPSNKRWMEKSSMVMPFHITQVLTGHGCFRSFLNRMNQAEDRMILWSTLSLSVLK
ncbi:Hypothetical protein CINCED_3A013433 [Cinara cedri]|uniref:Uncharacterized protein n=1 Tax=Cinara cedri TaxID=506608 RepID=A0A5E4M9N1_9HEMI|nr:Hypothetical protein CINCED_3A013433 [Cinara cedri]